MIIIIKQKYIDKANSYHWKTGDREMTVEEKINALVEQGIHQEEQLIAIAADHDMRFENHDPGAGCNGD